MDQSDLVRYIVKERPTLMAYAWSVARNEHTAEDVVQSVCLKALEKIGAIQDERHLAGWLRTAIRYETLNASRKAERHAVSVEPDVVEAIARSWEDDDHLVRGEQADQLAACIDGLTPHAQHLIRLRYIEGLSGQALAEAVSRSTNAVYVALSRAHKALAECMERHERGVVPG